MSSQAPRPLLVTEDPELLEDVLRLAELAGIELDVAHDPAAARRSWTAAPVVVVGGACPGLARRSGVVQVTGDSDDADVWQRAVACGAEHVLVLAEPAAQDWLVRRFASAAQGGGPDGVVVGVLGGRGGAGASLFAVALALSGRRTGRRVCLVDADPMGGGLDLVLGGEAQPGLRWSGLGAELSGLAATSLVGALPSPEGVPLLTFDRASPVNAVPPVAVEAVLAATRRVHDIIVVDLPRAPLGDLVGLLDTTLLVVPAEVRAAAAAARLLAGPLASCRDLRLLVRLPGPVGLQAEALAGSLGLPLAGSYTSEERLPARVERGIAPGLGGRGALARLCAGLLTDLVPGSGSRAA